MRGGARPYADKANGSRANRKQEMRPTLEIDAQRGSVSDPVLEKYLLDLHAAMDLESFWNSTRQLLSAAIPNQLIGLVLQHGPALLSIEKWTSPMPEGFFRACPLKSFIAAHPRTKFVRIADLFASPRTFAKSTIHRRYIAFHNCAHAACLFFRQARRLVCAIVIMRSQTTGDFSSAEMKTLRQFYPQLATGLERLRALDERRAVRADLEDFVRRLPLATISLRWNLKPLFQNRAAREFCAVWENGHDQARLIKTTATIPPEILEGCRRLKQKWQRPKRNRLSIRNSEVVKVRHPQSEDLKVTIRLKQLNDAVARPHFVIECEDLRHSQRSHQSFDPNLSQLVQLTGREQEVTRLVCNGRSNQEIADTARLSLATVKKHLHAVFRKLEVTSRSQLMALML